MKKDIASQNVCAVFYEVMEWSRGNVSLEKRLCEYREKCSLFILIFCIVFSAVFLLKYLQRSGFVGRERKYCWGERDLLLF